MTRLTYSAQISRTYKKVCAALSPVYEDEIFFFFSIRNIAIAQSKTFPDMFYRVKEI